MSRETVFLVVASISLTAFAGGYWLGRTKRARRTTLTVKDIVLRAGDLACIPEPERVLLVQLGHVHNVVNLLRRWLLSPTQRSGNQPRDHASLAQYSLAARTLAGALVEGWRVLQKSFYGTGVSRSFSDLLTPKGTAELKTLKDYFSRKNALQTVRDRFAFHFDREDTVRQLGSFGDDDTFHLYVSDDVGNSLYYLSETVVGLSMLNALGQKDDKASIQQTLNALHEELLRVSGAFDRVIGECLAHILTRHVPQDKWARADEIRIDDVLPIDHLSLPYFVSRPARRSPKERQHPGPSPSSPVQREGDE